MIIEHALVAITYVVQLLRFGEISGSFVYYSSFPELHTASYYSRVRCTWRTSPREKQTMA